MGLPVDPDEVKEPDKKPNHRRVSGTPGNSPPAEGRNNNDGTSFGPPRTRT
jgi:hypothetical protein